MRKYSFAAPALGAALLLAGCGGNGPAPKGQLVSAYAAEADDLGYYLLLDNVSSPEDGIDGTMVAYDGEELAFADVTEMKYNGTNLTFRIENLDDPTDWAIFNGHRTSAGIEGEWSIPEDEATRGPDDFPTKFDPISGIGTPGRFGGDMLYLHQYGAPVEKSAVTVEVKEFLPPLKRGGTPRATGHIKAVRKSTGEVMTDQDFTGDFSAGTTIRTSVLQWGGSTNLLVVFDPTDRDGVSVRYGLSSGRLQRR